MKRRLSGELASVFKRLVFVSCLFLSVVYIGYRLFFTLPLGLRFIDILFGIIVFLVEFVELFEFIVYFANNLLYEKRAPKIPKAKKKDLLDVDVFVATLDEDVEIVKKTILACKKMKYPRKINIYLCDDGNRKEMAALAKKMKVDYFAREVHHFAKAGNYNYALKKTLSPYVAFFDADMRPKEDFLLKTIPLFSVDNNIGFVQTPQGFRNADIFQSRFSCRMPCEQDYFYKYIQIARNNINSVVLCGTNCVILRDALKAVGGFACATIAEDIATGMLIESKGYRGIAVKKVLARGEAINDFSAFLKQRSRWSRGCIQTAKNYGIISLKGLSFRQKMDYLVAIYYWRFGLKRMLFMLFPLLFVFFHVIAIEGDLRIFVPIFVAQYLLRGFVIDWLEGNGRSMVWAKIFETIQAPYLAFVVFKELVGLSDKKFTVTPKKIISKKRIMDYVMLAIYVVLFSLNCFGVVFCVSKLDSNETSLYFIPLIWIMINLFYLFVAILFVLRKSKNKKIRKLKHKRKFGLWAYLSIIWREK